MPIGLDDDGPVGTRLDGEHATPLRREEPRGVVARRDDHGDRGPIGRAGQLVRGPHDVGVPEVEAIELADGHHRFVAKHPDGTATGIRG